MSLYLASLRTACCEPFQRQVQYKCNTNKLYQIHLAPTDYGELMTLVAGKQPSLLMAGNNDEVYDKKHQRYAEDNVTQ